MRQSPDAPYWLALLNAPKLHKATAKRIIREWCLNQANPLAALYDLSALQLAETLLLSEGEAQVVLATEQDVSAQADLLAALAHQDIGILTRSDIAYPENLIERMPEERLPYYIWYRGNLSILAKPAVAIMGSSQPDGELLASSNDMVKALAASGYALVGGYGKGIDRSALQTARQANGSIILILPVGVRQFAPFLKSLEPAIDQGQVLVLSPYPPDAELVDAAATARLLIITALAEALVLYEPEASPIAMWPWSTEESLGRAVLLWSGSSDATQAAWKDAPISLFDEADSGCEIINGLLGYEPPAEIDENAFDALPGIEPLTFENPDQAIHVLSQTGKVPESLRRRLMAADWTTEDIVEEREQE